MNAETNYEKARRILGREAARQRRLVAEMDCNGVGRKDWTAEDVKKLRRSMRKQQIDFLERLKSLLNSGCCK